jgi:hypothetical protein
MILNWFDADEARSFGQTLANFYIERLPPSADKQKSNEKREQEVLSKMFHKIAQFKLSHKLNIYKKAQLGNTFKWALRNAGYPSPIIDALTTQMMLKL